MRSLVRWSIGLTLLVFAVTTIGLVGNHRPLAAQSAKKSAAVAHIPAEGFAVLSINAAKLHDAEVLTPLREALGKGEKDLLKRIEGDFGISLDQLERVTLYFPAAGYGLWADPLVYVTTRQPLDKAKLITTWKGTTEPKMNELFHFGGGFGGFGNIPGGGVGFAGVMMPNLPGCGPEEPTADAKPTPLDLNAPFYYCGTYGETVIIPIDDHTAVFSSSDILNSGNPAFLAALLRRKPDGPLAEALALADKHDVVFGIHGKALREQIKMYRESTGWMNDELLIQPFPGGPGLPPPPPPLPEGPGGEKGPDEITPYEPLAQLDRATVVFDLGLTSTLSVTAHYPSADAAAKALPVAKRLVKEFADLLTATRKGMAGDPAGKEFVPLCDFALVALNGAKTTVEGKTLTVTATATIADDLTATFATLPTKLMETADRMKVQNNLKQIGLALHNYESANGHLPRDVSDGEGKILLSWRVELLPYLEAHDLYQKIDRSRAWDDPANQKLWDEMPDVFKVPSRPTKEKWQTYLQTFHTVNWIGKNDPWLVDTQGVSLSSITDGLSQTVAVFEMAEPTNWMKPGENMFDPKKLAKIGDPKTGKANVVMLDGSVRTLDAKTYVGEKLQAVVTVNGGEDLDPKDFSGYDR